MNDVAVNLTRQNISGKKRVSILTYERMGMRNHTSRMLHTSLQT
jgi:hypothetical protein